jgi:hypothetical protein
MTRRIRITTTATFVLLGLAGCQGILDLTPEDQLSDEAVFADPNLAEAFLNDIYRGRGHGLYQTMLASLTDETHFIHGSDFTGTVVRSQITPSDRGAIGGSDFDHFDWSDNYFRIRQANIFLSQIDGTNFDAAWKQRMKGEALFLRAYFYHNLLRMYGGVPLITRVYGLNEDYKVARNSFKETVDFIVTDADQAAALLPVAHSAANLGRATKGASLALKARVLLYAASELYNANPSGQPENGYTTPQDRTALWRAAKDAARAVMDLGIYGLFRPNPAPGEAARNYGDLFLQKTSEEAIWSRFFLTSRDDGYHPGLHNGPNGYHNWGANCPIQNLIDDYRMADGSKFDWTNPVHAGAPYQNRDPRFYASVLYDGAQWRERPDDVKKDDPYGIVQTFRELKLPGGSLVPGLDTRAGPVESWNGSYSGYYLRKFIDPSVNGQFVRQEVPWVFFRYAEVLLNYAEASIELNELGDALVVLNQIRRRAGMPDFSAALDQATLRDEYRNERRIEMVFEEQRFFDVRRWMIAPAVLSRNAFGINIFLDGDDRMNRATWRNYRYETASVHQRAWNDKMYFMPIHRDELNRNSLLKQNPGY